jgi:hypothetical protein
LWYDVIKPDYGITGIHIGYLIYFTAISKAWYQTFTTYWWRICRINSNVFLLTENSGEAYKNIQNKFKYIWQIEFS